jgi:hypothetical protein
LEETKKSGAAAEDVWQHAFFVYTARLQEGGRIVSMTAFSNLMFRAVHWAARRGLREEGSFSSDAKKLEDRRIGVRGATYAHGYLWRPGYIFVARNYSPRGVRAKSISLVTMARRGHLWKSEHAPSARTYRVFRNSASRGKNNTWWFAPRSDFWRSARWVNVHAVRRDGNR